MCSAACPATLAVAAVAAALSAVVLALVTASATAVSSAEDMLITRGRTFSYGWSANAHADPTVSEIKQLHNSVVDTERW